MVLALSLQVNALCGRIGAMLFTALAVAGGAGLLYAGLRVGSRAYARWMNGPSVWAAVRMATSTDAERRAVLKRHGINVLSGNITGRQYIRVEGPRRTLEQLRRANLLLEIEYDVSVAPADEN